MRSDSSQQLIVQHLRTEAIQTQTALSKDLPSKFFCQVDLRTLEGSISCLLWLEDNTVHLKKILNNPQLDSNTIIVDLNRISRVLQYRYLMADTAVQLWAGADYHLISFPTQERRDCFTALLRKCIIVDQQVPIDVLALSWQRCSISNYTYLLELNIRANRSFNDSAAYPVFPWLVHQYGIGYQPNNPKFYRDLAKPISSINPHRLQRLKDRQSIDAVRTNRSNQDHLLPTYSSMPCYVQYFLLRKHPELIVRLQRSIIVPRDRIFSSVERCYFHTLNDPADFKELIPEFFDCETGTTMLENSHCLELGKDEEGRQISSVELPKWATSAKDFITKMRELLEGDFVSARLHEWIDLVFGWRALPNERKHNNDYNLLCYRAKSLDHRQRFHMEHFGQHPQTLFSKPHPKKGTLHDGIMESKQLQSKALIVNDPDQLGSDIHLDDIPADFFDDEDVFPPDLPF